MKQPITQKEALDIFKKTPFPKNNSESIFVLRFMFKLNELAKKRGYRLFNWTDFCIQDVDLAGTYIVSNIEELSKDIIKKAKEAE